MKQGLTRHREVTRRGGKPTAKRLEWKKFGLVCLLATAPAAAFGQVAPAGPAAPVVPGTAPIPGTPVIPGTAPLPGIPVTPGTAPRPGTPQLPVGLVAPGTLPPPATATGEVAPPLAVPPPPELLPAPAPTLPPGTDSPVPTTGPITLQQAIAIGLKYQPTVAIAAQNVNSAVGRTQQAASALYPSVTVNSGITRSQVIAPGVSTSSSAIGFNSGLGVHQLVFDFGHTQSAVSSTRHDEAATRADEVTARNDATFNIEQAYFTLLEDQRLADVDAQNTDALRRHVAEARAIWSAGRGTEADVVQAQTDLATALYNQSTALNDAAIARTNLAVTLGIDPRTPLQPVDVPASTAALPALNAMVAQAETTRPEVISAQQLVEASQAALQNARTNNLPFITADANLGLRGAGFPGNNQSRSLGLSLNWDVFDSGLTAGRVKEAQATLAISRQQLYQAQQTVNQDVTQAYLNVSNARQRLISAQAAVANAQESVRQAEGRFNAGVGIFLAVEDAQAALATAQANEVQAAYGLQIELAALNRSVGKV